MFEEKHCEDRLQGGSNKGLFSNKSGEKRWEKKEGQQVETRQIRMQSEKLSDPKVGWEDSIFFLLSRFGPCSAGL